MTAATLFFAIAFILGSFFPSYAGETHPQAGETPSAKMKTRDAEINIEMDDARSSMHCPLKVTIKNIGSKPLQIFDFRNGTYFSKITIESPTGEICGYTRKGKAAFSPWIEGSAIDQTIAPDATFTFTIQLEQFFELRTGKWILHFKALRMELPPMEFSLREADKG